MTKSDLVDVDVVVVHRTYGYDGSDRAYLVHTGDRDKAVWLPASAVELSEGPNGACIVTMPERLAVDKGLV